MISTIRFIYLVGLLVGLVEIQPSRGLDPQDQRIMHRLTELDSNGPIGYLQHQQQFMFNQRPTHFGPNQAQAQPAANQRGALIMPANNKIQTHQYLLSSNQHPSLRQHTIGASHAAPMVVSIDSASTSSRNGSNTSTYTNSTKPPAPRLPNSSQRQQDDQRGSLQSNIELALRHVSGDESAFQPSPTIVTPEHNFDWLNAQSSSSDVHQATLASDVSEQQNSLSGSQSPSEATFKSTTTEESNNIASNERNTPVHQQSDHLDQQQSGAPTTRSYNNYKPLSEFSSFRAYHNNGSDLVASTELNNQVNIYEGPATAPPPANGEYYFSSSEKLPNNERGSNAWWALGFGHEFERANNLTRDDYLDYCSKSELVMSNKQKMLCRTHPKIMAVVARGLRMAIEECQNRFTSNRWNCSLVLQDYVHDEQATSKTQVFGDVMKHPNRERSFLNAIVAAGIAHAMTKACSQGELPEECSCDKRIKSKNSRGKIEWIACSDDIDFGAKFSRDFTDNTSNESDTISMINTHNYEVGRRVFKSATDITCTCQYDNNGQCQTKKCWKHLGNFSDVGDELKKRYESATHVQQSSKDPHKLRPVKRGVRKPKRKDLVYIEESPDYCNADSRLGVLGTQNRKCNSTSQGPESCSILCCGRGYQVVVEELEEDCNCRFVWCCQLKCDKCKRHVTSDVCN